MNDAPVAEAPAARAQRIVEAFLTETGIDWELGVRSGEFVVTLPGERKLRTVVSLVVGEIATTTSAFVIRHPDENHEQFYRWLLRRNLRLHGLAYAIDSDGDVFVSAQVPTTAVGPDYLDQLFGGVLGAADEPFNDLLAIGFLTSMRKEWAWRISRGESTRNLEAFRHLLDPTADGGPTDRSG